MMLDVEYNVGYDFGQDVGYDVGYDVDIQMQMHSFKACNQSNGNIVAAH